MKKRVFSLLILAISLFLFSCGADLPEDEEIIERVKELVAAAAPLNDIYFGEGLPRDILREGVGNYKYISDKSRYKSIAEIKEETSNVFSSEYANLLFMGAFSAINEEGAGISYAPYIENNGELMLNSDFEKRIESARIYHFDTLQITKKSKNKIFIEIETEIEGADRLRVILKLVFEGDRWLLDSPTY